jgi:ferredoxin-NADP reductase
MGQIAAREYSPEELRSFGPDRMLVRVRATNYLAENINAYEVVDPEGGQLPSFTAGSHIDLYFRDGRIRQYSLCSSPYDRQRYVFAVQRELDGRGGSRAIFERVHVGRILVISPPRNAFALAAQAQRHLFLAGGIGITPIMSMIHELAATGRSFELHYCTRSREKAAFHQELSALAATAKVEFHHDQGDPARGLDIAALLRVPRPGTHLYYCGPERFMAAVAAAAAHWPPETVHFEHFSAPSNEAAQDSGANPQSGEEILSRDVEADVSVGFTVRVASTGQVFEVPGDKSIVQVLREHGFSVPTSCESGLCGTCRTRYLDGVPDHRDYVLDDVARQSEMLICCSRAKSRSILLDL